MIPFQIVMIPLYILTVQLGMKQLFRDNFPAIASAFGIFLLRQAFQGVPKRTRRSCQGDGPEFGIWWNVMIPAILSLIYPSYFCLYRFVGDFLWPLIVISKPEFYTPPLGVAMLASTSPLIGD